MPQLNQRERDQISTRLSPKEIEEIERLVDKGFYMNTADFVRQAIREKLQAVEVIELRNVSKKKAKQEILDYLKKNRKCYPSDIADALRLDIGLVISIVKDLVKEGRIR
ncbi:ribbon-helix-helix domain-containing protein [Acidobacteriia bacterium AH_259_A11_L15]|nr:ribbon-helix-helix domain-containing protein [Acidobacteriia bacterium AH_259_A11_L15]